MQSWFDRLPDSGPRYRAIVDAIDHAVRTGALRPGERLPPQRLLARDLGVDLTTVTRAYGLARDAGLIEGAGRLGSYVRNDAGLPLADLTGDSGMVMPPQPGFALLADAMRRGIAALLRAGGQSPLLQYQPSGGALRDREEAAAAFTARGMPTSGQEVVIAAGGQNALHAILGTALSPGDIVAAPAMTYPGFLKLARRLGLRLHILAGDRDGIDPDAIDGAVRAGAKALYLIPTNDNPTTATLDLDRRRAIAGRARRDGLLLIEDDAYGRLPAAALSPLAAFAPERCWHIASVAKIISPVLRVAHVRAPSAAEAGRLAADIHETAVMAPPLNAALVTLWLRDGQFEQLVAKVRDEGVIRQRIAAPWLAGIDHAAHPEGYHIWLRLPGGLDPTDLAARLRPAGLSIVPGSAFTADRAAAPAAVRISIGGAIDHPRLGKAFEALRAILRN